MDLYGDPKTIFLVTGTILVPEVIELEKSDQKKVFKLTIDLNCRPPIL